MCFFLDYNLLDYAKAVQIWLSSNTIKKTFGFGRCASKIKDNSFINTIKGITLRITWINTIYSASVVLKTNYAHWCTDIDISGIVYPWRKLNIPTAALQFHANFLPRLDSYLLSNFFPGGVSFDLRLADTSSLTWFIILSTRYDCDNSNVPYEIFLMLTPR